MMAKIGRDNSDECTLSEESTMIDENDYKNSDSTEEKIEEKKLTTDENTEENLTSSGDSQQLQNSKKNDEEDSRKNEFKTDDESISRKNKCAYYTNWILNAMGITVVCVFILTSMILFGAMISIGLRKHYNQMLNDKCTDVLHEKMQSFVEKLKEVPRISGIENMPNMQKLAGDWFETINKFKTGTKIFKERIIKN